VTCRVTWLPGGAHRRLVVGGSHGLERQVSGVVGACGRRRAWLGTGVNKSSPGERWRRGLGLRDALVIWSYKANCKLISQQPADVFGGKNDCNLLLYYFRRGGQNDCKLLQLNIIFEGTCPVAYPLVAGLTPTVTLFSVSNHNRSDATDHTPINGPVGNSVVRALQLETKLQQGLLKIILSRPWLQSVQNPFWSLLWQAGISNDLQIANDFHITIWFDTEKPSSPKLFQRQKCNDTHILVCSWTEDLFDLRVAVNVDLRQQSVRWDLWRIPDGLSRSSRWRTCRQRRIVWICKENTKKLSLVSTTTKNWRDYYNFL